jgi:hypothetical protein
MIIMDSLFFKNLDKRIFNISPQRNKPGIKEMSEERVMLNLA